MSELLAATYLAFLRLLGAAVQLEAAPRLTQAPHGTCLQTRQSAVESERVSAPSRTCRTPSCGVSTAGKLHQPEPARSSEGEKRTSVQDRADRPGSTTTSDRSSPMAAASRRAVEPESRRGDGAITAIVADPATLLVPHKGRKAVQYNNKGTADCPPESGSVLPRICSA